MAFLMKKVLKGVTSRWDDGSKARVISPPPMCPPSPDLTGLSSEEIAILKDVFRRQEEFERQETARVRNISYEVQLYEQTVHRQASTKGKIKHADPRLCRICFKTKFSDGLGRVCNDCHKRVCLKCGAFSKPKWDPRRNKNVKGRWRCNMCTMKRDAICKTGSWYHGASVDDPDNDHVIEKLKTSVSAEMSSDNYLEQDDPCMSDGEARLEGNRTDSELYKNEDLPPEQADSSNPRSKNRRRSLPASHVVRAVDEEDEEERDNDDRKRFQDRRMLRQRRQLRRMRRRTMPETRTPEILSAVSSEGSQDGDMVTSVVSEEEDFCEQTTHNARSRKRRSSRISLKDRGKSISMSKDPESSSESSSDVSYATKESSVSDGACSPTLISKIKRQNAVYCSSSSSILSDAKHSDTHSGGATSPRTNISRSPVHVIRERPSSDRQHERADMLNRRVTLQKCELIGTFDDGHRRLGSLKTHKPHEVILHRDKADTSHRTRGLGMRIVGGKECDNGSLGAFVAMVTKGGPADVQGGVRIGDQIVEWNGISLTNVTFEETRDIINQSGNVVQLKVLHRHLTKRPSEDNDTPKVARMESADWALCRYSVTSLPPISLPTRPRRRMLPKTPIEMKKETRRISGRILARIHYLPSTERLEITIMRAEQLSMPDGSSQRVPSPLVLVYMLPDRRLMSAKETEVKNSTRMPEWNKTFYFHNISEEDLMQKAIELTVWSQSDRDDLFLGEVLLDLNDASLDYEAQWFNLEDHDENSSPLPDRKRPEPEIPETVLTTADSNGQPCKSPSASPNTRHRSLPVTPSDHGSPKPHFRRSPSTDRKSPCLSPPRSPTNLADATFQSGHRNSFTSKVKRKMSNAVSKMSSSLSVSEKRDPALSDDTSPGEMGRSRSFGDESRDPSPNRPRSRKASGCKSVNPDLLAPPRPLSRTNSQSSFYENESDPEDDPYADLPTTPDRPAPEGDDITSSLGPGQVPPKPSAENCVCGDIRLGFMVSKGQLEVDVICARGLPKPDTTLQTDTYVKTYLVEGKKILQKKKTQVVKGASDLLFRRKIKYSACNVHGRHMKINIWERSKGFDKKKQCLGETVVRLDSLDLSKHTMAWYKMFIINSTDLGSNESLFHW